MYYRLPKGKQVNIPAPGQGDGHSFVGVTKRGNANELTDVV